MATRSLIGMVQDDATIRAITCHWDGKPTHHGLLLARSYSTASAIAALLALGDLSALGATLDSCIAYHRDRHESATATRAQPYTGLADLLADARAAGPDIPIVYVWQHDVWTVYIDGKKPGTPLLAILGAGHLPMSKHDAVQPTGRAAASTTVAPTFRRLATTLAKQIAAKRNPGTAHQNLTARRRVILERLAREAAHLERVHAVLLALADAHEQNTVPPILARITTRTQIETLLTIDYEGLSVHPKAARMMAAVGLDQPHAYAQAQAAMRERSPKQRNAADEQAQRIAQLERDLLGCRIPGFIPTSTPLADTMIDVADLRTGMRVLEPSAGKASIADRIRARHPDVHLDVIEIAPRLREILEAKGYTLVGTDFLHYADGPYDRVIMNPPFERGQDMAHIQHAYTLLPLGGRMITIVSEGPFFRTEKRFIQFREWLDQVDAHVEKLPTGSFAQNRDSDRTANVAARIAVITKAHQASAVDRTSRAVAVGAH